MDLAAILQGHAKMQQEFTDFMKCSVDEMKALRYENSRLRRKIEVQMDSKTPVCQPTEEESEYNPTPHTFTTTHHTTTIPTHHTPTLPTNHISPHHHSITFPTIIRHPIPTHLHKRHHPFIDGITETPLPSQWEAFTLECYGGDTNPNEHVKIYVTHVGLYTSEDFVMCKAFPTTLK